MLQQTDRGAQRRIERIVAGIATSDGAGVSLRRIIGQPALPELDPFLLLDEFRSDDAADYIAGFPEHPHRGFETVTYMLAGQMRHRDNKGNSGLLTPGSVQWMTAGRGIIHSEMPEQQAGLMWGFQLWVNLPREHKMIAPRYQDIGADRIPERARDGARVRVLAGEFDGLVGPVQAPDTQPLYVDVALDRDAAFEIALDAAHNACAYVYDGCVAIGTSAQAVDAGHLAVLTTGISVALRGGSSGAKLIVIAAKPLHEPVERHGPIVMNTRAELRRAFDDLRAGRF